MDRTVGKIEAATEQLDWAIRLLLDHHAELAAVTLASAAEEILGRSAGSSSAHERIFSELVAPLDPLIDKKYFSQNYMNRAKNWLKHWSVGSEPEQETFDFEQEATLTILRAIMNMQAHSQPISDECRRFLKSLPDGPQPMPA